MKIRLGLNFVELLIGRGVRAMVQESDTGKLRHALAWMKRIGGRVNPATEREIRADWREIDRQRALRDVTRTHRW